jgi:glycerophosphoryl diester phosphodiesterase
MIRVGHKGADLIHPGNTLKSFAKAVEVGVDIIELDVLRLRDPNSPLVIAHDWHDAERREPLTLVKALDAFAQPPLDSVEFDLDIKLPGREEEIVAALRDRDLLGRAMISTMEFSTLAKIRELEPELRRGWTYPRVTKDWTSKRWAKAPMLAALVGMRQTLPGLAAKELPKMGVESMWVYHPLISARLARITKLSGVELIAWTVDDLPRMNRLIDLGVTGLCSNDPRLFTQLSIEGPSR